MGKFLIRRITLGIFIVVFGTFVAYAVIRCLPSSYVENIARQFATQPNSPSYEVLLEQLNKNYGMDTNIFAGYFKWAFDFVRGNIGDSWMYTIPVTAKFNQVIWYSLIITIISYIFEICFSVPLGIIAARKQYSATDYSVTVFALLGISLPSFFFGTLLKYIFGIKLGWFEIAGIVGRNHLQLGWFGKLLDIAHHMVLPVIVLMMLSVGHLMRFTRTNMLEVLNADYIRTARAKGLSEKTVINKHAFRNTLIPLITYMSTLLPALFGGSMIIETVFQIPGIGMTAFNAMVGGDIPFTMFYLTFIMILTQISLIVADMLYAVVDPRVRAN